jgi:transposase InsO family protein
MKGNMGSQTRIGTVVPKLGSVKQTVTLTKTAKVRLQWMDYYNAHGENAALTSRHYGIAKSCFFKWKKRYDRLGPRGLTDQPKRPKVVRQPLTPAQVVSTVRALRKVNPEFSKYKLAVILKRDYGYQVSASTIGRIISRHNLFFTAPIKPKGYPKRRQAVTRLRKPKGLSASKPGELVEVDVKHMPYIGDKRYSFVTIDVVSKQASIYVSSTIYAKQGALAWKRARHELKLPDTVNVVTDNGSENFGAFEALLKEQQLTHYFARPRQPKDKPHVERFIGTLEKECIQWGGVTLDKCDQQKVINTWLLKYHNYRPHQSLGYLTPNEFQAKLKTESTSM